jgi:hypothetical protein
MSASRCEEVSPAPATRAAGSGNVATPAVAASTPATTIAATEVSDNVFSEPDLSSVGSQIGQTCQQVGDIFLDRFVVFEFFVIVFNDHIVDSKVFQGLHAEADRLRLRFCNGCGDGGGLFLRDEGFEEGVFIERLIRG